jgi:hypothetical protein
MPFDFSGEYVVVADGSHSIGRWADRVKIERPQSAVSNPITSSVR